MIIFFLNLKCKFLQQIFSWNSMEFVLYDKHTLIYTPDIISWTVGILPRCYPPSPYPKTRRREINTTSSSSSSDEIDTRINVPVFASISFFFTLNSWNRLVQESKSSRSRPRRTTELFKQVWGMGSTGRGSHSIILIDGWLDVKILLAAGFIYFFS